MQDHKGSKKNRPNSPPPAPPSMNPPAPRPAAQVARPSPPANGENE